MLSRVDWWGCLTLMLAVCRPKVLFDGALISPQVGSCLTFLGSKYNSSLPVR